MALRTALEDMRSSLLDKGYTPECVEVERIDAALAPTPATAATPGEVSEVEAAAMSAGHSIGWDAATKLWEKTIDSLCADLDAARAEIRRLRQLEAPRA